jgi:threonine dehydrogenase-like Zn-dependent dehydrogenase
VDTRQERFIPLPDDLGAAEGTLIRMAYIALTSLRVAPLQLGDAVVVYGMGLVGQFAAQLYQLNGAHPVIGIDLLPGRLAVARANGIITLNPDEVDIPAEVARMTGGRGPEVVVEATGNPAVVSQALDLVPKGGRVTLLGSTRGRVDIDVYSQVHRKGVQLLGAHESVINLDLMKDRRWTKRRNLSLLTELFAQGKLRTQGLFSQTISTADLPSMYEILAERPGEYLGVLVEWKNV